MLHAEVKVIAALVVLLLITRDAEDGERHFVIDGPCD
jgi:hypothetical protein